MSNLLNIILMVPQEGQSPWMSFAMMGLVVVVFYFFMIRPQMKRQKEQVKFRSELAKGDNIVTNGGIYGKIVDVKDTVVIMEVEDRSRMKVDKSAIVKDLADLNRK